MSKSISDWRWTLTHPQFWIELIKMELAERRRLKRERFLAAYHERSKHQ